MSLEIEDESEREQAEALSAYLKEIDESPNGVDFSKGYRWQEKKRVFTVDLSDKKNADLKKAIEMVKRRAR